jgi:hypothetical protein
MKSLIRILIVFFIVAFLGVSTLQAIPQYSTPTNTLEPTAATALTSEELVMFVSEAHYKTVRSFSDAFEDELHNRNKPLWEDVRPQLLKYWSAAIVDGDLLEFYDSYLWDWGYEMGFAFPLWKPELIENVNIISGNENEIIAEFLAPTNYETTEIIRIRLIRENGDWFIIAQNYGQSV